MAQVQKHAVNSIYGCGPDMSCLYSARFRPLSQSEAGFKIPHSDQPLSKYGKQT